MSDLNLIVLYDSAARIGVRTWVAGTGHEAPLIQPNGGRVVVLLLNVVQIAHPVHQLASIKGLDVEVRPFDGFLKAAPPL